MDVRQERVDQITDAQKLAVQKLMRIAIHHSCTGTAGNGI